MHNQVCKISDKISSDELSNQDNRSNLEFTINVTKCANIKVANYNEHKEAEENQSTILPVNSLLKDSTVSKKLNINEKKLYINQIIMGSSLNTSFNFLNKKINKADLNFEFIIEGDCLSIMLQTENK